jgi:hypothetical protein
MAHPWPSQSSGHPPAWGRPIDPLYWTDEIHATGATAAGAWTPANAVPAPTFAQMTGVTPSPATAWTAGQYVVCQDGTRVSWDASKWVTF